MTFEWKPSTHEDFEEINKWHKYLLERFGNENAYTAYLTSEGHRINGMAVNRVEGVHHIGFLIAVSLVRGTGAVAFNDNRASLVAGGIATIGVKGA